MTLHQKLILGTLCCCACAGAADGIFDDFSGYLPDTFRTDSPWKERAYGKHPSMQLAEENGNRFMKAAGGGDRHVWRVFDPPTLASLLKGNGFVLEFKNRSGGTVELGTAGRYTSGEQFRIRMNGGLVLSFRKQDYYGILKFEPGEWTTIRILFRKAGDKIVVTAAFRPEKSNTFLMDPELKEIAIPASEFHFKLWNGINVRLDGSAGLDDLSLRPLTPSLFSGMKEGTIEIPMKPLADHILPPRTLSDLSGVWECAAKESAEGSRVWTKTVVPGDHAAMVNRVREKGFLFRRFFEIPSIQPATRYLIRFERVSMFSRIYLNGTLVKESRDGWFPFSVDVTNALRTGRNELLVEVRAPNSVKDSAKKYPQGWSWFLPLFSGIPYPVHLETCGDVRVEDAFVVSHVAGNRKLEAEVTLFNASSVPRKIRLDGKVGTEFAFSPVSVTLPPESGKTIRLAGSWKNPRLWWPHDPHLYRLDLTVTENGRTLDALRQEFGFREIRVEKERICLNGVPFLHRRDSAIVYWKSTIGNGEAIRQYFDLLRKRGYNGVRLHSSANLRYIREADRAGILVSPESGVNEPRGHEVTPEYWEHAKEHLAQMVKTYRNHPSVIYWCISNEFASYYMKGTREEKAAVDARMCGFGRMIESLDPTRTWTASGDGELGGQGRHGPAPTLSFHYAWQPFKQANMLPNTAYWLEQGLAPWQGIVWDRTKPLILSEDMYHPYSLKPPHGMAWWAGNAAYDIRNGGALKAWHDAYRMLADGYYSAGVSGWNPWAVSASTPKNPLFDDFGPLMPDWLIAIRPLGGGFASGATVSREILCYNQTFESKKGLLRSILLQENKELQHETHETEFAAGKCSTFHLNLKLPKVQQKTSLLWKLTLESGGRILAKKKVELTIYPEESVCRAPFSTALVDPAQKLGTEFSFDKGRFRTLADALQSRAGNLVIACAKLTPEEGRQIDRFVKDGGTVLILELDPEGWKPVPCDSRFRAAFAFLRSPGDPLMREISDGDLRLWGTEGFSVKGAFRKTSVGICDILADCGSGQEMAALLRLRRGRGSLLLCQLAVVSEHAGEPAAGYVLRRLIKGFVSKTRPVFRPVTIVHDPERRLESGFRKMGFQFRTEGDSGILSVDGSIPWGTEVSARLKRCLENGGTVIVDRLTPSNSSELSRIAEDTIHLEPSAEWAFQTTGEVELDGVSNSDLLWAKNPALLFDRMVSEQISGKPLSGKETPMADFLIRSRKGIPLLNPCGAAVWRRKRGRLVVNNLNWTSSVRKEKAARVTGTLLHQLGAALSPEDRTGEFLALDLKHSMNRAFWHRPQEGKTGWFGNEKDDMRYFPVNVTGIDPDLHVPAPVEKFPAGLRNFGGIDFELVDPEMNRGKGCVVLNPGESLTLKPNGKIMRLWFFGAAGSMLPKGKTAALVRWSGAAEMPIRAGFELNGYHYLSECESGVVGWVGRTPERSEAVLWVWSVPNPRPEVPVDHVTVTARVPMALIAVTAER